MVSRLSTFSYSTNRRKTKESRGKREIERERRSAQREDVVEFLVKGFSKNERGRSKEVRFSGGVLWRALRQSIRGFEGRRIFEMGD